MQKIFAANSKDGAQHSLPQINCGLAMLRINVWRTAQTVSVDRPCLFEQLLFSMVAALVNP
jgi:hypothetical protein